jgi:hypothetical protein
VPKGRSDLVSRHREPALRDVPRPRPPSLRQVILPRLPSPARLIYSANLNREVIEEVTGKIASLSPPVLGNSSKLPDALQVQERSSDCLPLKELVFECRFKGEQKPKAKRPLKLAGN